MNQLRILPCLDSDELAVTRKKELAILPELAESLGRSAVEAIELGYYHTDRGKVEWSELVQAARECERPAATRQSSAGALLHRSKHLYWRFD